MNLESQILHPRFFNWPVQASESVETGGHASKVCLVRYESRYTTTYVVDILPEKTS